MTTRKKARQFKLFAYSTLLWIAAVAYLGLAIFFYENAKAEPAPLPVELSTDQIGFWYDVYNGTDAEYKAVTVVVVASALDAYAYGKGVDFGGSIQDLDFELVEARRLHTISCFGEGTKADVTKAFFGWTIVTEAPRELRLGAAIALFVETVCALDDASPKPDGKERT